MSRLPNLRPREVMRALERAGFVVDRQTGSHAILYHAESRRWTTVAQHPGDVPRPILKQIIRQAGLTEDAFRELL